jgi:hypothetical protein
MSQNDHPKAEEIVIRGLLRLPDEMSGAFSRLHKDKRDFLRREKYLSTGKPENGISVFRKTIFDSPQKFYDRIGSKKPMGIAECKLGSLMAKNLKYTVSGAKQEHLSLRCPDCDMVELDQGICKPQAGKSFHDCPFFGRDPLDLNGLFEEVEAPDPRILTKAGQKSSFTDK